MEEAAGAYRAEAAFRGEAAQAAAPVGAQAAAASATFGLLRRVATLDDGESLADPAPSIKDHGR
jgi:hypothetical protein